MRTIEEIQVEGWEVWGEREICNEQEGCERSDERKMHCWFMKLDSPTVRSERQAERSDDCR